MKMRTFSSNLLAVFFFGSTLLPGFAAQPAGYEGEKWTFLDAAQAFKAAGDITLAKYPDSDDATVEKKMVRVYHADGTGESQDESFVKVLTEKGKRRNRGLSLY